MEDVALRLASSGAELASALQEPTDLEDHFTAEDLLSLHGVVQAATDAETFVSKPSSSRSQCREALQTLYKLASDGLRAKADSLPPNGVSQLPPSKLVTANFHVEQIWGQIDVLAQSAMKRVRKAVKHNPEGLSVLQPSMEEAVDELITGGSAGGGLAGAGSDGSESDQHQDSDEDIEEDKEGDASEDSGGEPDELAADLRDLEGLDYDAMLAAGTAKIKKRKLGGRVSRASKQIREADEEGEQIDTDASEESDEQGGLREAGEELLPTEDDFLRLDDMEAFVQQAEAAHAAGDTGGFDTFQELLEGNELGGAATAQRKERMQVGEANSDDDSEADLEEDEGVEAGLKAALGEGDSEDEVDLYAALDSDGEEQAGPAAAGGGEKITYEDFFGRSAPYSGQKRARKSSAAAEKDDDSDDPYSSSGSEEDDEEDSDGGDSGMEHVDGGDPLTVHNNDDVSDASRKQKGKGGDDSGEGAEERVLSTHEKRQLRVAREIEKVEEDLMADKAWQFRGEATAKQRPKDSALEVDLDFDRTMRPPPQPTLEAAVKLEDLIKERIHELRFDNVVRVNVADPEHAKGKSRKQVELTDSKSKEGLADEYVKDYHATVAGVTEDRHSKTRAEMKCLFAELSAKLDALSHLSLTPKPIVTDLEVQADVPAIAMEEAAPVVTSVAAMQAPEEAHAKVKGKNLKSETERTQAERHASRATKKRVSKRKQREEEESKGVWAHDKGIKSAREDAAAAREAAALSKRGKRGKFGAGERGAKKKGGAVPKNTSDVFKSLEAAKSVAVNGEGGSEAAGSVEDASAVQSSRFMY